MEILNNYIKKFYEIFGAIYIISLFGIFVINEFFKSYQKIYYIVEFK